MRSLPARPSLRHLKLEAKRRLTAGEFATPPEIAAIAARARAELGLPALLLAGGEPGGTPWAVAAGHAGLDRNEPLQSGHRFPVPGVTALVTGTAVLRLVADGRLSLDDPANHHLRAVSLADDSVTVRELLSHTAGVDSPAELYADSVPELAELMGRVISCGGPRGTVWPGNGGICVLGQLVTDVTGMPYATAAARLVLEPLGMRDSRFPAHSADIGPGAVTSYTVTPDGALEPFPAQVSTMPAVARLWATGTDLVRLATGWPSLLPAALARAALTPQAEPGPAGIRAGLGWLLNGETAAQGGAGLEAVTLLRSRVRDRRPTSFSPAARSPSSPSTTPSGAPGSTPDHTSEEGTMYQPYPGSETQLPDTQRGPAPAASLYFRQAPA